MSLRKGHLQEYKYEGNEQPSIEDISIDHQQREYFPYIPDKNLVKAVNLAIKLKRPLLLEGEPGCGKTRLADALAYEFTQKHQQYLQEREKSLHNQQESGETPDEDTQTNSLVWWPYYTWNVKSVGQARDGLYSFDAVTRLRDVQLIGMGKESLKDYWEEDDFKDLEKRLRDKQAYRQFGKLGAALAQQMVKRPIVLIDEIDKADSDFPNDLLMELDRRRFEIPETGEIYPKDGVERPEPIIIITSNQERPLPEPFLRRCLYYYLDFPKEQQLKEIIKARFGKKEAQEQRLIEATIKHVQQIRDLLEDQPGSKSPGTSELIDFLTALQDETEEDVEEELYRLAESPHLLGILLKTQADQRIYRDNEEDLLEELDESLESD